MENIEDKIVIYQTDDGNTQIDVRLENETVWLSQTQMVDLFQTTKQNVSLHVNNVFKEGELDQEGDFDNIEVHKIKISPETELDMTLEEKNYLFVCFVRRFFSPLNYFFYVSGTKTKYNRFD